MGEQNLMVRIGRWFKRGNASPDIFDHNGSDDRASDEVGLTPLNNNGNFLRPWAKRDNAIANLQNSFNSLTDLMDSVRDHLERQSERQQVLIDHLSHLPQALQQTVETNRVQSETLQAIHQQIAHSNTQQTKLGEILDKLSTTGAHQGEILSQLNERVDNLHDQDLTISDSLNKVGQAMQSIGSSTLSSSEILDQMRQRVESRDGELERILLRQNTRFTTMLAIAIFLSIAALAAVGVIGYLMLQQRVVP